jgi:hypothetical protein
MNRDSHIDDYMAKLPDWQQALAARIRQLIHDADPAIAETIKRGDRPYFTCDGTVCALLGAKDHLNVFIYDPIAPDPAHIINQGEGNATARSIQIYKDGKLNEQAFIELIKAVVANNRAGGWRKLSLDRE